MDEKKIDTLISQNWHRMQDLIKQKEYRNNKHMLQDEIDFRKKIDEEINVEGLMPFDEDKILKRLVEYNKSLVKKGVDIGQSKI